ncbi:unnamed protein product, partial [Ectocarpus sp. 13 AM-2016]
GSQRRRTASVVLVHAPSSIGGRSYRRHCLWQEHRFEGPGHGVRAGGNRRRQAGARELPAGHPLLRQAGGRVRGKDRGRGWHNRPPCAWTGGVRKPFQHGQAARHRLAGDSPPSGGEDRGAGQGGRRVRGSRGRRASRGRVGRPL